MDERKVIIVGGGLVGALCACFMAKRGYHVVVYEYRNDIRIAKSDRGKSINLALSNRGRNALRAVGLEEKILKKAIPMKGRFLHNLSGETRSILYDPVTEQCLYSVGRNTLNEILISASEKYLNVKYEFEHKIINVDLDNTSVSIQNIETSEITTDVADLIIGADGAYSTVRRIFQQKPLFDFSQNYIPHGYLELSISAENSDKLTANHLHIWPRGAFMMIALPNYDKSWTVTLVMPFERFKSLDNREKLLDFFKSTFPDFVPLIGAEALVEGYFKLPPSPLISIKCNPYHQNKCLIVGDAAHAMLPFYGQGMNAGFEDCWILDKILNVNDGNFSAALQEFSERRIEDAHAICDLATYNYEEMRDLVMRRSFYLRKIFDNLLFKIFPTVWIPLYNSVTFSSIGYKKCIENRQWQNMVILKTCSAAIFFLISIVVISVL